MSRSLLPLLTTLACGVLVSTTLADTVPVSRLENTGFVAHGQVDEVPRGLLAQVGEHLAMRRQDGGSGVHVGGGYVLTARHVWRDLSVSYPGQGYYVDGSYIGQATLPEGYRLRLAPEPGTFRVPSYFTPSDFGTWNDWALLQRSDLSGSGLKLRSALSLQKGESLWLIGDRTSGSLRVGHGSFDKVKGVNGHIRKTRVEAGFSGGAVIDSEGRVVGVTVVATAGGRGCVFVTSDAMVEGIAQQRANHPDLPELSLSQTGVLGGVGGLTTGVLGGGGGLSPTAPAVAGRLPAQLRTSSWVDGIWLKQAKAPLHSGDRLTRLAGHLVNSQGDVRRALDGRLSGSSVEAVVLRGSKQEALTLTFGSTPDGGPRIGARIDAADGGAVLLHVAPGGPAQEAGLEAGDLIVGIDGRRSRTLQAVLDAIRAGAPGHSTSIRVLRGGETTALTVTLD